MCETIRITICTLLLIALTALFTACAVKEPFYCEHCHQTKADIPHYITVNSVDTTVCTDCYESYQNGEWSFP